MVPWQEPWAGDIYSGSWKSIGPARIQIKGSVTHQPYKGKQIFSPCWCRCILWTCVLGGKRITCCRGRGTEVVKALVLVAAPLLLHKLKRVSRGDLKGERKFLLMTLRSRRCESRKRKHIWKLVVWKWIILGVIPFCSCRAWARPRGDTPGTSHWCWEDGGGDQNTEEAQLMRESQPCFTTWPANNTEKLVIGLCLCR